VYNWSVIVTDASDSTVSALAAGTLTIGPSVTLGSQPFLRCSPWRGGRRRRISRRRPRVALRLTSMSGISTATARPTRRTHHRLRHPSPTPLRGTTRPPSR
jgi:hypothetical protein